MFWRAREAIAQWDRQRILRKALDRLTALDGRADASPALLRDLVYGWGNEAWSADTGYLQAVWDFAKSSQGPVLECGSGLSTIVAAVALRAGGYPIHSLEHTARWRGLLEAKLSALGLVNAFVHQAPLRSYGDCYDWYSLPPTLPAGFELVICDGPPSGTKGGRYGLLPSASAALVPEAVILLDDMSREEERNVARAWATEYGMNVEVRGSAANAYAVIRRSVSQ